jgi:hypothetical protein
LKTGTTTESCGMGEAFQRGQMPRLTQQRVSLMPKRRLLLPLQGRERLATEGSPSGEGAGI